MWRIRNADYTKVSAMHANGDFDIILPSIEQQNVFVALIEQVNKTKSAIQKTLEETQLLFDSLMQKYFG